MATIEDIRDIVNKAIPGVGRGITDYAIKKLGIEKSSGLPEDLKNTAQEIIKHIQTLYGTQKSEAVKSELLAFL